MPVILTATRAASVLELVGDVLWTRELVELKRATFAAQDEALDEILRRYRVGRVCMDQTGMGEKPVEDAQRRYGASRVEGVIFTAPNKLVLATAGKERFEDRTIRIPEGIPALRADLHKLRKIAGPTGAPRFVAERTDDHADRTWACFLAVNAAGGGWAEYAYTPVVPRNLGHNGGPPMDEDELRGWWRPPLGARLSGGL